MSERLKSMRRLARVQNQVKRLAEADLHQAEVRKSEIEAAASGLDGLMADPDLSPRLVKIAMGQRRQLAVRQTDAERVLSRQVEVTRDIRTRFRLAERMVEDIARDESRLEERKHLEALIERLGGFGTEPDASLP